MIALEEHDDVYYMYRSFTTFKVTVYNTVITNNYYNYV